MKYTVILSAPDTLPPSKAPRFLWFRCDTTSPSDAVDRARIYACFEHGPDNDANCSSWGVVAVLKGYKTSLTQSGNVTEPPSAAPAIEDSQVWNVTWTIEIDADTAEEAAREALRIQRDPHSTATHFTCARSGSGAHAVEIDLLAEADT